MNLHFCASCYRMIADYIKGDGNMGIYIWGTGCGASELLEAGLALEAVAAFVDSYPKSREFLGKPVLLPEELPLSDCELLVVTARQAGAIGARCAELGIPADRILFLKNNCALSDRNNDCVSAHLLPDTVRETLLPKHHLIPAPAFLRAPTLEERDLENDYVRLSTLELLCRRLDTVPGAAAELGVYRGWFARCINTLLPERKLYLFDSFAGFLPGEATESFQAAHEAIDPSRVLAIQPHPEQIVLKPGFFPASIGDLEERFCLVSLDVDFEETTLEGLRWFWPRLNSGGYLMLHDWNNPSLPGVARALEQFEQEQGQHLPAVPLCDVGGTLVLCK